MGRPEQQRQGRRIENLSEAARDPSLSPEMRLEMFATSMGAKGKDIVDSQHRLYFDRWKRESYERLKKIVPDLQRTRDAIKNSQRTPDNLKQALTSRIEKIVDLIGTDVESFNALKTAQELFRLQWNMTGIDPVIRQAFPDIDVALGQLQQTWQAMGRIPPEFQVIDRRILHRKGSGLEGPARMGIFLTALGGALISGLITFNDMRKGGTRSPRAFFLYSGIAALAAFKGKIFDDDLDRIAHESGFLVDTGGRFVALQQKYKITGPDWATFAENLYKKADTADLSTLFSLSKTKVNPLTKPANVAQRNEARAKILKEITPGPLQSVIQSMKPEEVDALIAELLGPKREDMRQIVIYYIRTGAGPDALREILEHRENAPFRRQRPGTREA